MEGIAAIEDQCRHWLAGVLRGEWFPGADMLLREDDLLAVAKAEGVTALVATRLPAGSIGSKFAEASRAIAGASLVRTAECQRILGQFSQMGMPVLLLKGGALAHWLYADPFLRECSDIDVLLPSRKAVAEVEGLFVAAGYEYGYGQGMGAYEVCYRRVQDGRLSISFDVHWALNNASVFAQTFSFEELYESSMRIPGIGENARGLCSVHALLHACMHRAINLYTGIGERLKWLYDIHLLSERLSPEEWGQFVALCRHRKLGSVCIAGLEAAGHWFGTGIPANVLGALVALPLNGGVDGHRVHEWFYMQRMNLKALPSLQERVAWVVGRIFPSVEFLRELYGGGRGPVRLMFCRVMVLIRKAIR